MCIRDRKNTFTVELVKGDTIAHEIVGRFGATRVFLKPAPEGTGAVSYTHLDVYKRQVWLW